MIKTIKFHEKCFKLLNSWSITFEFQTSWKHFNFTNSWTMYSTFSSFKENTFIEHVKINLKICFQKTILNQMKFIWYQIWSCLTIVQGHVHECLVHWNGLLGDVRALIPGVQDQGGLVRGIHVQDGICCGHPINIWRMVWLWTQSPYPAMSHTMLQFW